VGVKLKAPLRPLRNCWILVIIMKRAHEEAYAGDKGSTLKVPRNRLRSIIGSRGSIVRSIEEQTGAQIVTPRAGEGDGGNIPTPKSYTRVHAQTMSQPYVT
jgi:hypothetical protein